MSDLDIVMFVAAFGVTWFSLEFLHKVIGLSAFNTVVAVLTIFSILTLVLAPL